MFGLRPRVRNCAPHERAVRSLRHFEKPSNGESATANCNVHALKKPNDVFQQMPKGIEGTWG
jgi:hypothetical protein